MKSLPSTSSGKGAKAAALQYLNGVRSRPEWRSVHTQVAVEMGRPAETILDFAEKHDIDRIVMASHGRTGLGRWVYGSVADKVLRAADRTVVLVRVGRPVESSPVDSSVASTS